MPLGIGRYSEHVKISTECFDDDTDTASEGDEGPCGVRFIGQQNIPLFNSRDISGIMYYIYNKNYSPLNSLITKNKYEMNVDSSGIKVYESSSKKGSIRSLFMSYPLTDILLVSTDYQHDKLFAIIFYGALRNCMIHLYLCNCEDAVRNLLNKCSDDFANNREIKLIEKSPYSDGLEIIHYKPYEKTKDMADEKKSKVQEISNQNNTNCHDEQNEEKPCIHVNEPSSEDMKNFKIPYTNGKKEAVTQGAQTPSNFGDFQTASTTSLQSALPALPDSPPGEATILCTQRNLLDDDDDFEDEFAELALKRNIYVPDHLQDKSIESTLLFQENAAQLTLEESIKPGFFSSYNKLQ